MTTRRGIDREIDDLFVFVQLILIEGLRFGRLDCSSKVVGEWRRLDCSGRLWDSCQNINKLQTLHLHPHSFNQSKFGGAIDRSSLSSLVRHDDLFQAPALASWRHRLDCISGAVRGLHHGQPMRRVMSRN